MESVERPRCSIIIPHYRTEEFTRLCLRSLRKHSRLPNEVIVVDNNSNDASLDYLRGLSWIKLIENRTQARGSVAHREALELGVAAATGEWLIFFHSGTVVLKDGWDRTLIELAVSRGAVGFSSKIRNIDPFEPWWLRSIRKAGDRIRRVRHSLSGRKIKIMSYCFGVRREIVAESRFSFRTEGEAVTDFYEQVIHGKHPFLLLDRATLEPLLWHTSNVTSLLTNQMTNKNLLSKFQVKLGRLMSVREVQAILSDEGLDK